jgi:hypothetical protein
MPRGKLAVVRYFTALVAGREGKGKAGEICGARSPAVDAPE